jgi:hypothetical protein
LQLRGCDGAGIARAFKSCFPEMYREYRKCCQDGRLRLGNILVWQANDLVI